MTITRRQNEVASRDFDRLVLEHINKCDSGYNSQQDKQEVLMWCSVKVTQRAVNSEIAGSSPAATEDLGAMSIATRHG